jgi:hypothetical protein
MRVPVQLSEAFGQPFEQLLESFVGEQKLLPPDENLQSTRFISRSVVPHVKKLSTLFNRRVEGADSDQGDSLDPYWKQSSNPAHLRLAYFLYFMPCNLFRVASVWAELARLGYQWKGAGKLKGIEFGSGPAAGATGVAAGEKHAPLGIPAQGDWALIEQDKATLKLGAEWAERYFQDQGFTDWGTRTFHRSIDLARGFLPPTAPRFNVWVMSFFLNELLEDQDSIENVARLLLDSWEKHLEDEALILLVEPALKLQSRKLLELRKALLKESERRKATWMKVLLPCLGHQACGALAAEGDWCHEEVSWWRPPYLRTIDSMAGLDRKTLPFSYLVIAKSKRSHEELLPSLKQSPRSQVQRLVSPAHSEGKEFEFFVCGQDGKRRGRFRPSECEQKPDRGDILFGVDVRGDTNSSRIERITKNHSKID